MNKYKEENGEEGSTDIVKLFNFWAQEYGDITKEKTLTNFYSKSFNNRTELGANNISPINGNS